MYKICELTIIVQGFPVQYGICRVSPTWELIKNAESQALPQESESVFSGGSAGDHMLLRLRRTAMAGPASTGRVCTCPSVTRDHKQRNTACEKQKKNLPG